MVSSPITSWQMDGETVETVADFIFLGSKITADGDCNHEIKRHLLLGRKVVTNLDSILKSRDITLPTKFCLVKAMLFQWSCMDVRAGLWRKLSTEGLMLLNCGVGEGHGNRLQYCLENPMNRGSWWATGYGVAHDWSNWARIMHLSYAYEIFIDKNCNACKI